LSTIIVSPSKCQKLVAKSATFSALKDKQHVPAGHCGHPADRNHSGAECAAYVGKHTLCRFHFFCLLVVKLKIFIKKKNRVATIAAVPSGWSRRWRHPAAGPLSGALASQSGALTSGPFQSDGGRVSFRSHCVTAPATSDDISGLLNFLKKIEFHPPAIH
jgi:hypothetical protein